MSKAFKAGSWPTFIVIDTNGVVRFIQSELDASQ